MTATPAARPVPPIVAFLTGSGKNGSGRTHADVLAFGNDALETHHDFIQWLFPLDEPSRAVPGSPVLDRDAIALLRQSPETRKRMAASATRMLRFYDETKAWRHPFDHNHLRITRIIKSLRLLVDDAAADNFKRAIVALAGDAPIDARARQFWAAA